MGYETINGIGFCDRHWNTMKDLLIMRRVDIHAKRDRFKNVCKDDKFYCVVDPRTWTIVFSSHVGANAWGKLEFRAIIKMVSRVDGL